MVKERVVLLAARFRVAIDLSIETVDASQEIGPLGLRIAGSGLYN